MRFGELVGEVSTCRGVVHPSSMRTEALTLGILPDLALSTCSFCTLQNILFKKIINVNLVNVSLSFVSYPNKSLDRREGVVRTPDV